MRINSHAAQATVKQSIALLALTGISATILTLVLALMGSANAASLSDKEISASVSPLSMVEKQTAKAKCLAKPGYIWIESTKRCVKQSRGSY